MNRIKHVAMVLVAVGGTLLILATAARFLIPHLLNNSNLGNHVRREISALVEGDFQFDRFDFAVFPSPHAVLINPQLSIPDRFSASVEAIELYPDVISSLTGHITVNSVAIKRPEATVWISPKYDEAQRAHLQFGSSKLPGSLVKTLSRLPVIKHGTVSQGRITLIHNRTAAATFENLDAELQNMADAITIDAAAASKLVKKITLKADIHPGKGEGGANLDIGGLDLGAVTAVFSPDLSAKVEDGTADISIALAVHGGGDAVLDFNGSIPHVRLSESGQAVDLDTLKLSGTAELKPSVAVITVAEFHLDSPAIHVCGNAAFSDSDPQIRFDLKGQGIDVSSTRAAALAVAGSGPAARTVFEILKEGTIEELTVSGQADDPRGLADLDNLVLHGSLVNGNVFIPGAGLELADVSGTVNLSKGILSGQGIAARWQQSRLRQGRFEIDLTKDQLLLSVDTKTDIQAADVPKILTKFITDKSFSGELERIDDITGSATGTLSLAGELDRLDIAASAVGINVSVRHRGLPFQLNITDGGISYDSSRLHIERLSGSMGTSVFTGLSGNINLGKAKAFAVTSGTSHIVLKDMLPWLSSFRPISGITQYYGGGKGMLHLTEIQANGSSADLDHVHFKLAGELQDLTVQDLPAQPGPLVIASMNVAADPQTLVFTDVQAHMLDGSVNVSGTYPDYMEKHPQEISVSFAGHAGPRLVGWITELGSLPPWLKLRPLRFRESQLSYAFQGGHKVSADLALQEGLELITEFSLAKGNLDVDSLKVQDNLSKVSLTARKKGTHLDVSYDGTLHESTLDSVIHLPMLQGGSIDGKAKASLNVEAIADFSFQGELSGKQISVLTVPEKTLMLKKISVNGVPGHLNITSADLSWDGAAASVTGKIWPGAGTLPKFALDVGADTIDMDLLMKSIAGRKHGQETTQEQQSMASQLEGDVHVKVNRFIVRGYLMQPLEADVRFREDTVDATLDKAVLCDIPGAGTVTLTGKQLSFLVRPNVQAQELSSILECLFDKQFKADGTLDVTGSLSGHGSLKELARSTTGQAEIRVSDGHIYHDLIILNLLKFLNFSQILTGRVSAENMMEKGVGFDRFEAQVRLQNGILIYDKFVLDGDEFKLGGSGRMDLLTKRLNFTLLVAPLKASSNMLAHIPLIGEIFETIDTIPLQVGGPFKDIHIIPLAPSAVEKELGHVMSETLGIPLKLVHLDVFREKGDKGEM